MAKLFEFGRLITKISFAKHSESENEAGDAKANAPGVLIG
jgi:hypothetical protein